MRVVSRWTAQAAPPRCAGLAFRSIAGSQAIMAFPSLLSEAPMSRTGWRVRPLLRSAPVECRAAVNRQRKAQASPPQGQLGNDYGVPTCADIASGRSQRPELAESSPAAFDGPTAEADVQLDRRKVSP